MIASGVLLPAECQRLGVGSIASPIPSAGCCSGRRIGDKKRLMLVLFRVGCFGSCFLLFSKRMGVVGGAPPALLLCLLLVSFTQTLSLD